MIFSVLKARVKEQLDDRTDLDTKIAAWINDTRKDLALEYDFSDLYVEATCTTSAGTGVYALPDDCLDLIDIFADGKKLIRLDIKERDELTQTNIDVEHILYMLATESTLDDSGNAPPDYYIIKGNEIDFWPIPDGAYTLLLKYYAQPADFTADGESDRISNFHFDVILWGAALRGANYLDDESKIIRFTVNRDKALKMMVARERRRKSSDKRPRMKSYKDFDLATFQRMQRIVI